MSKKSTILLIIVIILIAGILYFSKNNKNSTTTPPPGTQTSNSSLEGCYVAKLAQDIYTLQIQSENNGAVSGKLAYNNYQKDSSSGTFAGTLTGDVLLGTYSFDSEGMHSNRQVIFKKVGNDFVEGFGDVKTVGDTETLTAPNDVTYDPNSTFKKDTNCTENFTASNGSFSFDYNAFFAATAGSSKPTMDWQMDAKQNGVLLASVSVPRGYMPQTNFDDAKFTIGMSSDTAAIKNCLADNSGRNIQGEATTVSNYPFTKFTSSDAGAGNLYDTTSYHGIVGGDCYVVEYTIHSSNIGNYPSDSGIKEFDKNKIVSDMEAIIKSFRLIVASN